MIDAHGKGKCTLFFPRMKSSYTRRLSDKKTHRASLTVAGFSDENELQATVRPTTGENATV